MNNSAFSKILIGIFCLFNISKAVENVKFIHGYGGDYETWGDMLTDIDLPADYVSQLIVYESLEGVNVAVSQVEDRIPEGSFVVAHSMGGLVSRKLASNSGNPHRIEKLITVSTPNLGFPGALSLGPGAISFLDEMLFHIGMDSDKFGDFWLLYAGLRHFGLLADFEIMNPSLVDMDPGSGFLDSLNQNRNARGYRTYSISSTEDPPNFIRYAGALANKSYFFGWTGIDEEDLADSWTETSQKYAKIGYGLIALGQSLWDANDCNDESVGGPSNPIPACSEAGAIIGLGIEEYDKFIYMEFVAEPEWQVWVTGSLIEWNYSNMDNSIWFGDMIGDDGLIPTGSQPIPENYGAGPEMVERLQMYGLNHSEITSDAEVRQHLQRWLSE